MKMILNKMYVEGNYFRRFNGVLYFEGHKDISDQFIGSGKTFQEAHENAENERQKILFKRNEKKLNYTI